MPGLPSFSVTVSSMVRQHPKRDPFSLLWSLGPACVLSMRKWGAKCWRGGRWWAIHDVGGVMWRWRWCMVCTCKPFMIYETPWKSLRSKPRMSWKGALLDVFIWILILSFWEELEEEWEKAGYHDITFFWWVVWMPKCFQLFSYLFHSFLICWLVFQRESLCTTLPLLCLAQ